jgi:hypothetical protein
LSVGLMAGRMLECDGEGLQRSYEDLKHSHDTGMTQS